jgi:hypothetical protein
MRISFLSSGLDYFTTQWRARPRDLSAIVDNTARGYRNRVRGHLCYSSPDSAKIDRVTMNFLPSRIIDSTSLPRLIGAVFAIIVIHRVYIRYQEYQVNNF